MTTTDKWLHELAGKRKAEAAAGKQGLAAMRTASPAAVDDLWARLQQETRRQAAVYTAALGDPAGLVVETSPDQIDLRGADGRQLTLRFDREKQTLSEAFRNQTGGVRLRRPIISFSRNAAGDAVFNFGPLSAVAACLLRRVIR